MGRHAMAPTMSGPTKRGGRLSPCGLARSPVKLSVSSPRTPPAAFPS